MNKTILAMGIGALLVSSAAGERFVYEGADASTASKAPAPEVMPPPAVVAQATAAPAPERPIVVAAVQQPIAPQQQPAPYQPAAPPLTPQEIYMQDQAAVARINAQIEALQAQPRGGFAVTYYAKPAPPQEGRGGYGAAASNPQLRALQEQIQYLQLKQLLQQQQDQLRGEDYVKRDAYGNAEKYVVARAGDTVYATLDRAFNSDDPQAPIFATIHDVDEAGIQGPLDGVRMIGNIKYSSSQGAIQFDKGYLPDGRSIDVKGIAISEDTARTGVAKNVDTHDIERYGSLLFATLVQGVGQVGQVLTQNQQQAQIDPTTGLLVASQKFNPYEAAAGALLPAGQALTAVAAQNFNKPATISAPAGYGLGIVFLGPVALPNDVLFARRQ